MTSLPFLYPRMVRPLRGAVVRQFLRAYSESSSSTSPTPSPLTSTASTTSTTSTTSPTSTSKRLSVRRDPIPFELPPDMQRDVESEERIEGTITPMERQAFDKIFSDISRSSSSPSSASADSGVRKDPADIMQDASSEQFRAREHVRSERREALEASISVLGRLDSLDGLNSLDNAGLNSSSLDSLGLNLDSLENPDASARRRALAEFPLSLRNAASDAIGSRERLSQQLQLQKEDEKEDPVMMAAAKKAADTAQLRQKRQEKMERVMLSMRTDAALWEYMEECVFSMVDEFGLQKSGKGGQSDKSDKSLGEAKGFRKGRKLKLSKNNSKLLTYAPVYPAVLLHGLRLLGGHYNGGATSPLALCVLPRMKSLGLQSYVLGASTPLYNELLRLQWTRLGDAVAVFALLQEMQQAGLAFNDGTLAVLKSMEFHLGHMGHTSIIDPDSPHRPVASRGTSFVDAAMQHLPDVAAVPSMVEWWRKQVEAGAIHSRRFS